MLKLYQTFTYVSELISSCPMIINPLLTFSSLRQTVEKYKAELQEDPIIQAHLESLYDNLLEQNLCRIIEPFSRVQVSHVAEIIKLPLVSTWAFISTRAGFFSPVYSSSGKGVGKCCFVWFHVI